MSERITKITLALMGKLVTLEGLAVDCKSSACLKLENDVVYIEGMDSWEEKYFKKTISISGIISKKKLIPDPHVAENGAISQGAKGVQTVLSDFKDIKILK